MNYIYIVFLVLININNYKTSDHKEPKIFKTLWSVCFAYNNFLVASGVSYNFYDLLKQTRKNSLLEQILWGFFSQNIINIIVSNIINITFRFYDMNRLLMKDEDKNQLKKDNLFLESMALWLDNYCQEKINWDEFFMDMKNIIQKWNVNNDQIYMYLTIINDNPDVLLNIASQLKSTDSLLNFKNKCIFFPLLQMENQGNFNDVYLHKLTYPTRPNYGLIHQYFFKETLYKPYRYAGRWVLSQKIQQKSIKECSLEDVFMDKEKDKKPLDQNPNISDSAVKKNKKINNKNINNNKKFNENFEKFSNPMKSLILMYVLTKFITDNKKIATYHQKMYWLICKIYSEYYSKSWYQKLFDEYTKKMKSQQ